MKLGLLAVVMIFLGTGLQCAVAQESADDLEVIVVSGRQPGPPLWRVTHGENTLWIFPVVSVVPRDIEWDDTRVKEILADSEEVIGSPGVSLGVSKGLLFNPVNWVRGPKLLKRLSRNPDNKTLQEVLPSELYQRYVALQQKYFPSRDDIDTLRPAFAIGTLSKPIFDAEKLTGPKDIERHVGKLIKKQKSLRQTEVEVEEKMEGNFAELSARIEKLVESLPKDSEIGCFDTQLNLYEHRLDDMKRVANAWAAGHAAGIERYSTLGELEDPCTKLLLSSSEGGYMEKLIEESSRRWLDAAEKALANNRNTFAMLSMVRITGAMSLVDKLAAKGYTVHAPR